MHPILVLHTDQGIYAEPRELEADEVASESPLGCGLPRDPDNLGRRILRAEIPFDPRVHVLVVCPAPWVDHAVGHSMASYWQEHALARDVLSNVGVPQRWPRLAASRSPHLSTSALRGHVAHPLWEHVLSLGPPFPRLGLLCAFTRREEIARAAASSTVPAHVLHAFVPRLRNEVALRAYPLADFRPDSGVMCVRPLGGPSWRRRRRGASETLQFSKQDSRDTFPVYRYSHRRLQRGEPRTPQPHVGLCLLHLHVDLRLPRH
mmetsp:Transcript_73690/g.204958  ORF Transcript_73690/g.204958 Transcript_73690/m.204958 type:complete len:262 (+) Transcript_73690:833-1618(+)